MRKYKAKVIHNVEIVLEDDSELNEREWLTILATNIAYHKCDINGRYVSQEIEIEEV